MNDTLPFPLNSVWEREYSPNHWVVFYVCEIQEIEECRCVGRILAKDDPNGNTSLPVFATFKFDWFGDFASKCKRIA